MPNNPVPDFALTELRHERLRAEAQRADLRPFDTEIRRLAHPTAGRRIAV